MKLHSGWLAAGLLLFVVLACNTSKNSNENGNSNNSNNKNSSSSSGNKSSADVFIEQINMAKDKDGDPGESTTSFAPDDLTVHCVIHLNKAKAGTTVKFTWVSVNVEGLPKDLSLKSIDYTTNSFENNVHAHLTSKKDWSKGTYKVEVYINGALDKTVEYNVE